jgi:hypothetical protein
MDTKSKLFSSYIIKLKMNTALNKLIDNNTTKVVKHCNSCDIDVSYSNWARHISDRHEGIQQEYDLRIPPFEKSWCCSWRTMALLVGAAFVIFHSILSIIWMGGLSGIWFYKSGVLDSTARFLYLKESPAICSAREVRVALAALDRMADFIDERYRHHYPNNLRFRRGDSLPLHISELPQIFEDYSRQYGCSKTHKLAKKIKEVCTEIGQEVATIL